MSSRLLTMKFMQRAAASQPSSPSSNQSTPQPPNKKVRLSNGTASPVTNHDAVIQESIAQEEAKREEALAQLAQEAGETKWVLSVAPSGLNNQGAKRVVKFTTVSLSDVDRGREEDEGQGRRRFGNYEQKKVLEEADGTDESASGEEDEDEDDYEPQDVEQMISAEGKRAKKEMERKRKEERVKIDRLAQERRKRELNLNSPRAGGISSGGSGRGGSAAGIECHNCGRRGHKASDCPQRKNKSRRSGGP